MEIVKKDQNTITTLSELISILTEKDASRYTNILKSVNISLSEYQKYATWSKEHYTRNCVEENENFELILICWEKEQATVIHDHGGEECWVYNIDGNFKECIYEKDKNNNLQIVKTTNSKPGDVTYMVDFMGFHNLKNESNKRSMSLHLYAKPIKNCKVFDAKSNTFVSKKMSYDNVREVY